jgi:hypothetical protein
VSEQAAKTKPRNALLLVGVQVTATAALLVWLLVLHRPLGKPGEWVYRVNPEAWPLASALPAAAIALVLGLAAFLLASWGGRLRGRLAVMPRLLGVLLLLAGLPSLYLSLAAINPVWLRTLVAYQMSDVSTGYLAEAYRVDGVARYLREFAGNVHRPEHLRTRPPGAVLFYYALRRLDEAFPALGDNLAVDSVALGGDTAYDLWRYGRGFPGAGGLGPGSVRVALLAILAICVSAAAAAALLFWLLSGRRGMAVGFLAAALLGLSPACALFFQCLDMLVVFVAVLILAVMGEGWPSPRRVFGLGVLLGLGSMISLSALALAVAVACVSGGAKFEKWRSARGLLALVGGFAAVCAVMALAGLKPLDVLENALAAHRQIAGADSHRSYSVWVWLNVVEFAIFLGLPTFVAACWWRRRELSPGAVQALGAAVVLVAVSLGGYVLGETGRILAPLMPLMIVYLAESEDRPGILGIAALLTFVQTVGMALAMQPVSTPF